MVMRAMVASGHPRVGGEHRGTLYHRRLVIGSSPRGRGTPFPMNSASSSCRVIPAWAGNTGQDASSEARLPGHPRVGGEHQAEGTGPKTRNGSSPHGRGTLADCARRVARLRVIPAWAGNTSCTTNGYPIVTGHPRVGGEHVNRFPRDAAEVGSSPRGRGTRLRAGGLQRSHRVIPAWAGNTTSATASYSARTGHPRVGGEHIGC